MLRKLFIPTAVLLLMSCSATRYKAVRRVCDSDISKTSVVGICIYDITAGKTVCEYNADQRMRPASCMKILTAVATLEHLGPQYTYVPQVGDKGWGWCWDDSETNMVPWSAERQYTVASAAFPMLKNSNNMFAESMFRQLSSPYTRQASARRINTMLNSAGVDTLQCKVADGSGLSLYNYLTPRSIVKVLVYAYRRKNIYRNLYSALPIAGVDGTLRNRMKGTAAENNVHAKTGTVTGISSLSGYYKARNGHEMCFSIINQGIPDTGTGRRFQDNICIMLCR